MTERSTHSFHTLGLFVTSIRGSTLASRLSENEGSRPGTSGLAPRLSLHSQTLALGYLPFRFIRDVITDDFDPRSVSRRFVGGGGGRESLNCCGLRFDSMRQIDTLPFSSRRRVEDNRVAVAERASLRERR